MKRIALPLAFVFSCMVFAANSQKPTRDSEAAMQGEDINLRMFSSQPTFGEVADPTFWVRAKRGRLLGEPRIWTLEETQAVIYRDPEEDLVLVAGTGTFDEVNKSAELDGGVRVTSGQFAADMANIRWDDATGVASTDSRATLDAGMNQMIGSSVALYVNEDRFELGEGSARIQLAAAQPGEAVAEKQSPEFESISIPKHNGIVGNLKGGVREIRGPAELVLKGVDPANTLNIKADHIELQYDETSDDITPIRILLKGRVSLVHTNASVKADQGTVNIVSRTARFESNVEMSGDRVEGAKGDYLEVNLETGDMELGGANAEVGEVRLIAPEKAENQADSTP